MGKGIIGFLLAAGLAVWQVGVTQKVHNKIFKSDGETGSYRGKKTHKSKGAPPKKVSKQVKNKGTSSAKTKVKEIVEPD